MIIRYEIDSSAIEEASYEPDTQELEIVFTSGSEYVYMDVPRNVADGLESAESAGRYYRENIKEAYAGYNPDKLFTDDQVREVLSLTSDYSKQLEELTAGIQTFDDANENLPEVFDALDAYIATLSDLVG